MKNSLAANDEASFKEEGEKKGLATGRLKKGGGGKIESRGTGGREVSHYHPELEIA